MRAELLGLEAGLTGLGTRTVSQVRVRQRKLRVMCHILWKVYPLQTFLNKFSSTGVTFRLSEEFLWSED